MCTNIFWHYADQRFRLTVYWLGCILAITYVTHSQPLVHGRDAEALSALHASLVAMTDPHATLETSLVGVTAVGSLERPNADGSWETAAISYTDLISSHAHEYRRRVGEANGSNVLLSNHGNPKRVEAGSEHALPVWTDQATVPDYSPYALLWLAYMSQANVDLRYLGHQSFEGRDLIHISVITLKDDSGVPIMRREWYLDAVTMLPAYSLAAIPTSGNPSLRPPVRIAYSKYGACGVHLCPMDQTHWIGKHEILRLHLTSSDVSNNSPADAIFTSDKAP